jgi:4'-phosphopantetheinyl transferase EntD
VGSIAHCRDVAVAAAAPVARLAGLGVDVEPDDPLTSDLWDGLFTETERAFLDRAPAPEAAALRLFCAKEAAYKAHYPRARQLLEPRDVALRATGDDRFEASFPDGASIAVRVGSVAGFVLAAATVPADARKRSVSGEEKANSWQFRGKGDRNETGVKDVARRPGA